MGRARLGPSRLPCSGGCPILETLEPSTAHLPLPSLSPVPSFSGLRWRGGPQEVAKVTRVRVHRARRAVPGPPRGDGAGQGPTGSPLAPLSTEKYLPRVGGGLVGLARKGRGGWEGHRVACAGDVLNEVGMRGVPLLLHALAGRPLSLEMVPLRGTWGGGAVVD